jgi:lipopolysaccharide biosynthesis regulator YciM
VSNATNDAIETMKRIIREQVANHLGEIIERYTEAYEKREAGIGAFLDDEGELKEGSTYEAYDEHCYEAWSDSHGDLGSLLAELEGALR